MLKKQLILSVLVIFMLVPFCNRALFIDDFYQLTVAKNILQQPLKPYSFSGNEAPGKVSGWEKGKAPHLPNPVLIDYYMALILKIFGRDTIKALRASFIPFAVVSALCIFYIAGKFSVYPMAAALLAAGCPAFLVPTTAISLDSALLCFFLLTITVFMKAHEKKNTYLLFLSSIIMGLTFLVKYTGLSVAVITFLWLLFNKENKFDSKLYISYFVLPLIIFGFWNLFTWKVYGEPHFLASLRTNCSQPGIWWAKLLTIGSFLSGGLVFPVLSFILIKKLRKTTLMAAAVFAILVFYLFYTGGFTALQSILVSVFVCGSCIFIILAVSQWFNKGAFLVLWFGVILLMNIRAVEWSSVRYFMLLIPPAAIMFTCIAEKYFTNKSSFLKFISFAIAFVFLTGLSVNYADYLQAGTCRALLKDLSAQKEIKGKKYFVGSLSTGISYYLDKEGWETLSVQSKPVKEDIILTYTYSFIGGLNQFPQLEGKELQLSAVYEYKNSFPLRVMNKADSAGFYCSFVGILPYVPSTMPLERYMSYLVR